MKIEQLNHHRNVEEGRTQREQIRTNVEQKFL